MYMKMIFGFLILSQIECFWLILTPLLPVGTHYYCECMKNRYSPFFNKNSGNDLGNENQGFHPTFKPYIEPANSLLF